MSRVVRNRIGLGLLATAFAFLVGTILYALWAERRTLADPDDAQQVARGKSVYSQHCGACHGLRLEGQPNWQEKLPTGRMPAPPHDASGHTWHHPDSMLFGMTKLGLIPGKYAPPNTKATCPRSWESPTTKIWAKFSPTSSPGHRKSARRSTR
jgi:hypothetical protein